jgi:hypothetical protein
MKNYFTSLFGLSGGVWVKSEDYYKYGMKLELDFSISMGLVYDTNDINSRDCPSNHDKF